MQKELERRSWIPRNRKRKPRAEYILMPRCAHCGIAYDGGKLSKKQGETRCYIHPIPKERLTPEQYERTQAAGCKRWVVEAAELESGIKDLILEERASADFEERLREMLLEQGQLQANADELLQRSREQVKGASAR